MAAEPVWITLTGVRATGFHGVLPEETRVGQEFIVDVQLETAVDLTRDELDGTVNYAEVAETVVRHITGEPLQLIETLAGRIADDIASIDAVTTVEVVVHKPHAPIPVPFTDVTITVIRSKQ
ncbi:dihydroneopterin aldolase [Propionibacteriaceae bacterium Y1923]|uniref:dihydroneopterin aldolase n=1 Tax=Aestuariimicrobium sp. Y1814 TaxID=3418742 RepID=UPI003C1AF485